MKKRKTKASLKKRLIKKVLTHPASLFMLLCTGLFLAALTIQAVAITIRVGGRIPAPPITQPAVIEILAPIAAPSAPAENNVDATTLNSRTNPLQVSTQQVTLSGSCPKASHIVFYRNDVLAGVAQCIGDPTFSITLDLEEGINVIKAQVFNITDDGGPLSIPLYISYVKLPKSHPAAAAPPLILSAHFTELGFLLNTQGAWALKLSGGNPPYNLLVDWGDGSQTTYQDPVAGEYTISHTYHKVSGGVGFSINITAYDTANRHAFLQLLTIVAKPGTLTAQHVYEANQSLNPNLLEKIQHKLWIVWPAYLIVLVAAASFWLGEREEYKILSQRRASKRRRK